ncbi:MAG: DHH family phosphoesterase, partial [Lachnospiraceae bacterium]|nr:DHH family phosphoesterase [Lachnospiraceae bacterium]
MSLVLNDLIEYDDIVIQCHDNPDADALASGYALKWYLNKKGKKARFVYGGRSAIQKSNLILMVKNLGIEVEHVEKLDKPQLLVTVDCQYGESNVTKFEAETIAVIDHHQVSGDLPRESEVRSNYGSCSTVMYELLQLENIDINDDEDLSTALYYGLMTDTGGFTEISHPSDKDLRDIAKPRNSDIVLFKNSNISKEELVIAGDALKHAYYVEDRSYAIVEAKPCDPNILGIISDMLLEVDSVETCLVYSVLPFGIKISVRSCVKEVKASEMAAFLTAGYGGGGGHLIKAGGLLKKDLLEHAGISYDSDTIGRFLDARM